MCSGGGELLGGRGPGALVLLLLLLLVLVLVLVLVKVWVLVPTTTTYLLDSRSMKVGLPCAGAGDVRSSPLYRVRCRRAAPCSRLLASSRFGPFGLHMHGVAKNGHRGACSMAASIRWRLVPEVCGA